ncbi:Gx transporter family protein [Herbinix luporum]|uniref:Putative membrane protein n=1 Tax=Herbinix luporum TaxID=1679721 RepID=A0A0K8J5C6_9FIRM|nr:Gx transporter family protein [Herbinix luporum]MDI9488411.1 Gx transporter family protein [Bacillota bacterium]CUH92564.1 putative membrane protein [Herbinix luporum]HHT56797.1 Gx transporter family protein [Herbinix luporum]
MNSRKIASYGLFIALAFIFSYIESLIPMPFALPGMKLGLANLVIIVALYGIGVKEAFVLSMVRILLVGFTFRDPSTLIFSFAGGILSWLLMTVSVKFKLFSMVGVSILGGIAHNIGQIIVAMIYVNNPSLIYYLPLLMISGLVSGALIGILAALVIKRLKKFL